MTANLSVIEALEKAPLFSDLNRAELEKFAVLFKPRKFTGGKVIVREGQGGEAFFIIESGAALVTIGGEERTTLSNGEYFGEIALFDEGARTATITANEDLTCLCLSNSDFRRLVEENGDIGWKLLQRMTRLFRER